MLVQDAETDPKYRCAECNLQFGTPRDLSRHLNKTARHGGQPSPCAICHKPLTRPDSRARHERRCRERFGVTEEMWQGIERERQRGRRKSISVDGADEAIRSAGDCDPTGCDATVGRECCAAAGSSSSRSRTVSEVSDAADLAAAFASAQVGSSTSTPIVATRFVAQPGEPGPWARKRSTSLLAPQPSPVSSTPMSMNDRKRQEPSPRSRGVPPPPPHTQARGALTSTSWRPLNRPPHNVRDHSPPFDPPSSPMAMYDESDGESMEPSRSYQSQPRWTPLVKREERLVELGQDGEDEEVDELEDEPWIPPVSPRAHQHHLRTPEGAMGPPPKKKLFGFEQDGHGHGTNGVTSWSSHKTQR